MYEDIKLYQQKLLDLLCEFDLLCKENSIKYSLTFGTLIGAVRHKGFIPWDDDVDVIMDRNNYEKLIKVVNQSDSYCFKRKHWIRTFKRNENNDSAFIDLFPFDIVPRNELIANIKLFLILLLQGMIDKKVEKKKKYSVIWKLVIHITAILGKLFPLAIKQRWFDKVSIIGKNNNPKYIECYSAAWITVRKRFDADLLSSVIPIEFEGKSFWAVEKYDEFLTRLYGEYMKLPPEDQRVPSHSMKHSNISENE